MSKKNSISKSKKKSSKRIDPLKIASFTIIGLLVLSIATVVVFNTIARSYHISSWSELTKQQDEGIYFVYLYQDSCEACRIVAGDVETFRKGNTMEITLFKIDAQKVTGVPPTGVNQTPTVLIIEDGKLQDIVVGVDKIRELFSLVDDGDFTTE